MGQRAAMQHSDYSLLMSLVLDDEATETEARSLREHLAACDTCARTWQRFQELDRRFELAPVMPVPVDFSVAVTVRLDQRMEEQRRRRWFMLGLAFSWLAAMLVAVLAFGVANGWHLQLLPDSGSLSAAWAGVSSIWGWLYRSGAGLVERTGTPTVAAAAGALLCVTCGLATIWLWMVARLAPAGERRFAAAE